MNESNFNRRSRCLSSCRLSAFNNLSPMATPNTSGPSSITAIFNSFRRNPTLPVVNRLLELCVHYQKQTQDSQNRSSSSSSSSLTTTTSTMTALNQYAEERIKALVKVLTRSKKSQLIDELERAIVSHDSKTKCVIVPR
jgi:hypothetical protein